jgi:hypothetical protein
MLELDLQHQGQERAEDVAANGLIELVEDGSRGEEMLFGAEDALYRPQLLVAEHGGERVEIGIRAQHEDAVEAHVLGNLGAIDGEVALADGLEEAAIARVADQRLVAPLELALEGGYQGRPVGRVLLRLLVIDADDVAPPAEHHRLGAVVALLAPRLALHRQRHERHLIGEHHLAHQLVDALARAQDVEQLLICCRRTRISASSRTFERNKLVSAVHSSMRTSTIGHEHHPIRPASQPYRVSDTDRYCTIQRESGRTHHGLSDGR